MPASQTQSPPPSQQQPQQPPPSSYDELAAVLAGPAATPALAAVYAPAAGTVASAAAVEAAADTIIGPILDLARLRWNVMFDPSGPVADAVSAEYPGRDFKDVMDLVDARERTFEREFRRKMRKRLAEDVPAILREPDIQKRADMLAKVFRREMRYTAMREEAILSRAMGAIEADMLQTLSPKGAYWKLSPHVKEHTLDCLAMGEKFWPWSVLRKVQPPLHYGCPCYLLGLDEVVEMGLMTEDQVPDEADARARYGRIADKVDDLRGLDEAAVTELYEAAYENLTEAPVRGVRRPLRWAKGFVKGGQFRPTRGGSAGRALSLPESPMRQRGAGRGRWTWVDGAYTKIPEADAWTKTAGERTYHSPPGGTNLYVNGELVNEPGQPSAPAERQKMSTGTVSPPPELAAGADAVRTEVRKGSSTGRGMPPISVGDGPSAILGLADAGFTLESARPGGNHRRTLTFKASDGTLTVEVGDKGTVADLQWDQARTDRSRTALDRPAFNWDEHASDALAMADELGDKYGADVAVPQVVPDNSMHDHAGTHLWSGEVKVGADTPKDIDRAGRKRQAGKPLTEDEKRGVYASYWVTGHEVAHGVNPISPQYFRGANANLEEALAEEMGHKIALDRLAKHGQYDVIDWRFRNPDALAVRGVYPNERHALAQILDEAGVPEADREKVLEKMKFQMKPESRLQYLATLVAANTGGDIEESRNRVEQMLANPEPAPADFRSVINPRQLRDEVPAHYGEWDWSGPEPSWTADGDALSDAIAAIQSGPQVLTVGDQVPVAKYADGSFGVGEPHGSSDEELTFVGTADQAAEMALGRSDYAAAHSKGYKSAEGSAPVSAAQSASDNAMLYFAQHSGAPVPLSPGVAASAYQRKEVQYERNLLKNQPEKLGLPADKPSPPQFGIVDSKQAEEIGDLVNEATVAVRMDSKGFSEFLDDGQMKPASDTGTIPMWRQTQHAENVRYGLEMGPDPYMQTRTEAEAELFGAHPVYGYFRSPESPYNTETERSGVFYGNVIVEMKPEIKDRTTWTLGDSLNAQRWLVPSPVGDSNPLSVPPLGPFSPQDYSEVKNIDDLFGRQWPVLPDAAPFTTKKEGQLSMVMEGAGSYAEAQIFGSRPTLDDVARVVFVAPPEDQRDWDPVRNDWGDKTFEASSYGPTKEQREALDKAGIPWVFVDAGSSYGEVEGGTAPYEAPDETDWKRTGKPAKNRPLAPPKVGDGITPRAVEEAPPGAEIELKPGSGPSLGGFAFVSPEETARRRLVKRDEGHWEELDGENKGKRRTNDWVAKETQKSPRSKGELYFAVWSAYPQPPRSPGTLPEPPESPGWFTPGGGGSPWLPRKKNDKKYRPKPREPKVIGGSDEKPVIGGPFKDYNPVRLTMDKPAGGGNGAMWAKDSAGNKWLVKTYRGNEDRIATELVANRIYDLLGAKVADAGTIEVDGRTALTYRALDGAPRDRVFHTGGPSEKMGEHYMADALLANWDFAGLTDDNVLWDAEGDPIRIDQGGTLEVRAMGQPKDFGPVPTDVWTMLRKGQAKRASKVTEPQMREQAAQIRDTLTPEVIDRLLDAAPFRDREMRERVRGNLKARVDWMGRYADGDVDVPQIPEGSAARDEFRAQQAEFEVFPEELAPLNFYVRGGAVPTQRHLRSKEPSEAADPNVTGAVDALDAILKDAKTAEDVIVYVPVDGDAPDGLVGKTVSERGFIHATTDLETAMADGSMVRLLVPAGSHVVDLHELGADLPGDAPEIVVRRGSRMKFTGKAADGSLEATLMPPARPYAPSKAKGVGKGQMGLPGLPEPPKSPGVLDANKLTLAERWMQGAKWSGVMYHGTDAEGFDSLARDGVRTPEFFMTRGESEARGWAHSQGAKEKRVVPVAVRFDNPLFLTNGPEAPEGLSWADFEFYPSESYDRAREAGYDGVVAPQGTLDERDTWAIALKPDTVRTLVREPPKSPGKPMSPGTAEGIVYDDLTNDDGFQIFRDLGWRYRRLATNDDAGRLDFIDYGDYVEFEMLEVDEDRQREGIATRLWNELLRRYPDTPIYLGGFTDEGEAWASSVTGGAYWVRGGQPMDSADIPRDAVERTEREFAAWRAGPKPPQSPGTAVSGRLFDVDDIPVEWPSLSQPERDALWSRPDAPSLAEDRPNSEYDIGNVVMPAFGTTLGDERLPLYRFIKVKRDRLGDPAALGFSSDNPNFASNIHWTHSYSQAVEIMENWYDYKDDEVGVILKASHPGRGNIMDWDNPDDLPVMERTIGGLLDGKPPGVEPEVPVRPGTELDVYRVEVFDRQAIEAGGPPEVLVDDLPSPPRSPGTPTGRETAATMDENKARETLEKNNIRVGQPDPAKAAHAAEPTFLGTLAYLSDLYPEVSDYITTVDFASGPDLAESPVEGGARAGRFAGGIRRSGKAGGWEAQVIMSGKWQNPDGSPRDNKRAKMVYNDLHGKSASPGSYLDDFDEGATVTVKGEPWRHEGDLWYRVESKYGDTKVLDENGLAISKTSEALHFSHAEGQVVGSSDPTHTPAHEFAHGLAGAWTDTSLSDLIREDWMEQLRENPSFVEPMSYSDFWNITDQLKSRGFTKLDIGWKVFRDAGISMQDIKGVSSYAASEPAEAFAELFSAHYLGLLSTDVDEKFEALMDKMRAESVAGAGV